MPDSKYEQGPWRLDDLFSSFDAPEVSEAMARAESLVAAIEAIRPDLSSTMEAQSFLRTLADYEALQKEVNALFAFASLRFAADTQDQQAQTYLARFRQLAAEAHNRILFFELWWKELEDEAAQRLMDASGDLRYWLESLRLERPYTLSEAEERIINLKNVNGPAALMTLLSTITDRYVFQLEINGQTQELTRDELAVYYQSGDAGVRQAAYQELFRVYE
ncbi:MAG: oligoendopeptidase F, partial [Candidatus Promineifilaceae bacterium]